MQKLAPLLPGNISKLASFVLELVIANLLHSATIALALFDLVELKKDTYLHTSFSSEPER